MTPDETEYYTEIGQRIQAYRTACGLTQADLCSRADLVRSSIANFEAGRQAVPLHKLDAIAKALDVTVSSLLPGGTVEGRPLRIKQAAEKARAALDEFLALFPADGGEPR